MNSLKIKRNFKIFIAILCIIFIKFKIDEYKEKRKSEKLVLLDNPAIIDNSSIFYLPYVNYSFKITKNTIIKKYLNFSQIRNYVNEEFIKIKDLKYDNGDINEIKMKIAIILPYRDRLDNLKIFLINMHKFLMKQNIEYGLYVIEPTHESLFNRGLLMNIGFKEALSDNEKWNCFIFHDVDMIPEIEILYKCNQKLPMHYSVAISEWNYW